MGLQIQKNSSRISSVTASLVTGICVFSVLSFLLIPFRISFPLSVFMAFLSFGLVNYYSISYKKNADIQNADSNSNIPQIGIGLNDHNINGEANASNVIFIVVFLVSLAICFIFSRPDLDNIYSSWYSINVINIVTLGAGIILSFFLPGYAVLMILIKGKSVNSVLKILLAYLLSMLITGLTIYLSELFIDNDVPGIKYVLGGFYTAILALFVISYHNKIVPTNSSTNRYKWYQIFFDIYGKFSKILKFNFAELIVFISLLGLLIVSTSYLYGAITIGDQWYHQNRALYFLSGQFKGYVFTNGDYAYPPLQSALLAGTTMLSGIPLVNTYASIAFLNITAVFSFYYFCSTWFPKDAKRAALLAASLFLIGSGFGWIYMIGLTGTHPVESQISSISNFLDDKIKFSDILRVANFMIAAHPDFSTALIYAALPAGFVLLGLVKTMIGNKLSYMIVLSMISLLGILFHDEFYFFMIVSSTLPLIFNMQRKYSVYCALLLALAFTYAIDLLVPVRYFTTNAISGFPLIGLTTIFTIVMLCLYTLRQNQHKIFQFTSLSSAKKFPKNKVQYLVPKAVLVGGIFYLYMLCLVIFVQLPADLIGLHTLDYNTPWYLYSLRLGIIGILGAVSILSYAFRRFEAEVLVFGLIIIFALFAGPYYNEQRFDKFVMAGMIGFASLFLFRLSRFVSQKKPILNGVIISSVIIAASLSSLMYVGFNALVMDTHDSANALGRRNFPSNNEMNVLDMMRSKILFGDGKINVASFSNEYNAVEGGIMTKLHAFSGLPIVKIPQTNYILNATTLDSFYNQIEKSNTRYILIHSNSTNQSTLGDPAHFAFENFHHVYDDNNYLLLEVPTIRGPSQSSQSDVGMVYKKDSSLRIPLSVKKIIPFSNFDFNSKENDTESIKLTNNSQGEKASLYGYKKQGGKTIWSKNFESLGMNYIESKFRVLSENKTGEDRAGIKWREGSSTYTVSISNKGLELRRQLSSDHPNLLLYQNTEVKKSDLVWYTLKVQNFNNSINVYLDNLLKIKIPSEPIEKPRGIAKVAIYSTKNTVEFEPIEISKIGTSEEMIKRKYDFENNYPISSLAFSKSKYDTYIEGDMSVLSKQTIILPFDPPFGNDSLVDSYYDYARSGGTLVVIDSDGKFNGSFAKLLSIKPNSNLTKEEFTDVVNDDGKILLNAGGLASEVALASNDTDVVAYYRYDHNKLIAPFAVEKHFANSGRIIYVNAEGYFDSIYNNPKKYFESLKNFSGLLVSPVNNSALVKDQASRQNQFIGNVDMSGKISINSSSFSLIGPQPYSQKFVARDTYILGKDGKLKNRYENLSITNLHLSGRYSMSIDSVGMLTFPGPLTQRDYTQISVPNDFNLTLTLFDDKNTQAEIIIHNKSSFDKIKLGNESKILFRQINSTSSSGSVSVMIKNPLITIDGRFALANRYFYSANYIPLHVAGHVEAKFGYIDDFKEFNGSRTRTQFMGYMPSLSIQEKINEITPTLKLPGEIPTDLKKKGLDVPLISILDSISNIVVLIAIAIGTIALTWYIRTNQRNG